MGIYRQGTKFTIREVKLTIFQKEDSIICSELSWHSGSHFGLVNDVEKNKRLHIKLVFTDLGDVISSDI